MKTRKDFKYTSRFQIASSVNLGSKESFASNKLVSEAKLEDLIALLPAEAERLQNPDLQYTAFPAFTANIINSNEDGMLTDTALAIAPFFKDKQCNIEHMRSYVIGHVINHGYSKFLTNEPLSYDEAAEMDAPFNITLAAVVYKVVDEYFAEVMKEASDPSSYRYQDISASWEIGFDEFVLALGSRNLSQAEIVKDEKHIKELVQYARFYGGAGFMPDGTPVGRVIIGNPTPLGIGFTGNPAAPVKGVAVASDKENEEPNKSIVLDLSAASIPAVDIKSTIIINSPQKEEKNIEKSSQAKNNTVKDDNMKINSLDDIQQDSWAELKASDVRGFIRSELTKLDEEYKNKLSEKETAEATLKQNLQDAVATAEQVKADLEKVQKDFENMKVEAAKQNQIAAFNERMSSLDESYDLDEKAREVVARQIRELSDEAYATWRSDFDALNSASAKSQEKEEGSDKSKEEKATEALATASEKDGAEIPNANGGEVDLIAKYKKSFQIGEGVLIK